MKFKKMSSSNTIPTDGYIKASSSFPSDISSTRWHTYNGQRPQTIISFSSNGQTISLNLKGISYPNSQVYYKAEGNKLGEYYIKVNSVYNKIYVEKSTAYPASKVRKKFTFTGFTLEQITYEMQHYY